MTLAKHDSKQPPPAPRKRRLRKSIQPSGRVKRKLNFDEDISGSVEGKYRKLEGNRNGKETEKTPAAKGNEEAEKTSKEKCTEPKSEGMRVDGEKSRSLENEDAETKSADCSSN